MSNIAAILVKTIPSQCELGEGPVWDERINRLWWTDIQKSRLHFWDWDWDSDTVGLYHCPERLGSFGLTSDPEILICAFASGFAAFHPADGWYKWILRSEHPYQGRRFNDGKMDRDGNFWAGTMVEDEALSGDTRGAVFRLASDGTVTAHVHELGISNSIAWSPDGQKMWLADSTQGVIWSYDHKVDAFGSARLSNRQDFARLSKGSAPDGSECDSNGHLWNAEWGCGRVTHYAPDGVIIEQIPLPVSQPTCLCFCGPDLDHIVVTTAREGLNQSELERQPEAGYLFLFRTTTKGLPAPKFQLSPKWTSL